jgi:hypothetical protein
MYITKQTYYAYPKLVDRPSGSVASERQGHYDAWQYQDCKPKVVAFFTKNGHAVCEDGRWANGGAFTLDQAESLPLSDKVKIAFTALQESGLKFGGSFAIKDASEPPVPIEWEGKDKFPTKQYAEQSLAKEIAEKKAQIRQLEQELKALQGLVGDKIKI